jgi:hypothetical protein
LERLPRAAATLIGGRSSRRFAVRVGGSDNDDRVEADLCDSLHGTREPAARRRLISLPITAATRAHPPVADPRNHRDQRPRQRPTATAALDRQGES